MTDARTEARWDHARDLAKHDGPRPHDPPLPDRLNKPIAGAMEVAILVKGNVSYSDAAALIEQYARTKASEAALQATIEAGDRFMTVVDNFGSASDA